MATRSTKGVELEYEKQEKQASRSKKKQSRLRKQMKQDRRNIEGGYYGAVRRDHPGPPEGGGDNQAVSPVFERNRAA